LNQDKHISQWLVFTPKLPNEESEHEADTDNKSNQRRTETPKSGKSTMSTILQADNEQYERVPSRASESKAKVEERLASRRSSKNSVQSSQPIKNVDDQKESNRDTTNNIQIEDLDQEPVDKQVPFNFNNQVSSKKTFISEDSGDEDSSSDTNSDQYAPRPMFHRTSIDLASQKVADFIGVQKEPEWVERVASAKSTNQLVGDAQERSASRTSASSKASRITLDSVSVKSKNQNTLNIQPKEESRKSSRVSSTSSIRHQQEISSKKLEEFQQAYLQARNFGNNSETRNDSVVIKKQIDDESSQSNLESRKTSATSRKSFNMPEETECVRKSPSPTNELQAEKSGQSVLLNLGSRSASRTSMTSKNSKQIFVEPRDVKSPSLKKEESNQALPLNLGSRGASRTSMVSKNSNKRLEEPRHVKSPSLKREPTDQPVPWNLGSRSTSRTSMISKNSYKLLEEPRDIKSPSLKKEESSQALPLNLGSRSASRTSMTSKNSNKRLEDPKDNESPELKYPSDTNTQINSGSRVSSSTSKKSLKKLEVDQVGKDEEPERATQRPYSASRSISRESTASKKYAELVDESEIKKLTSSQDNATHNMNDDEEVQTKVDMQQFQLRTGSSKSNKSQSKEIFHLKQALDAESDTHTLTDTTRSASPISTRHEVEQLKIRSPSLSSKTSDKSKACLFLICFNQFYSIVYTCRTKTNNCRNLFPFFFM
jgi:hypothetical protein